jgi:hypothetical protein
MMVLSSLRHREPMSYSNGVRAEGLAWHALACSRRLARPARLDFRRSASGRGRRITPAVRSVQTGSLDRGRTHENRRGLFPNIPVEIASELTACLVRTVTSRAGEARVLHKSQAGF